MTNPSSDRVRPREQWLDVAKGISIVSVVLFHAGSLATAGTTARSVWQILDVGIFTFIMPVFFLVSGMLIGNSLNLGFRAYVQKKIWPVAYLFVVWALIFAAVNLVSHGHIGNSLAATLALQSVLWFLAALAIYMLFAWITRRIGGSIVVVSAAVLAAPFAVLYPFDGGGLVHGPHFLVFFVIGCRAGNWIATSVKSAGWIQVIYLLAFAAVLAGLAVVLPFSRPYVYALAPLVSVPAVLISSFWISQLKGASRPLKNLGMASLAVFVVHILVLDAIHLLVVPYFEATATAQWVVPAAATVLAVSFSMLVWTVRKRVPDLFRPRFWTSRQNT